jgi:iron complex transport system ATP-binding protein
VPPGFTHSLVMKQGHVLVQGPIAETLTSEVLSDAFGLALTVVQRDGRFTVVGRP